MLIINLFALLFSAVLLAYGFFFVESDFFNLETFINSLLLILILLLSSIISIKLDIKVIGIIILVSYIYLFPRLIQYAIDPNNIYFATDVPFTLQELNLGLKNLTFMFFSFFSSIIITFYLYQKTFWRKNVDLDNKIKSYYLPINWMIIGFIIMIFIEYYIFSNPENSHFTLQRGEKASMSMGIKIFITSVSSDIFLFAFLFFSYLKFNLNNKYKIIVLNLFLLTSIVCLYIYMGSLSGSRGMGLRCVLMALGIYVFLPKNKDYLFYTFYITIIAGLFSLVFLNQAQQNRIHFHNKNENVAYSNKMQKQKLEIKKNQIHKEAPKEEKVVPIRGEHYWLFNRLGYTDHLLVTLSREPNKECKEKYLKWNYYYKNVINFLLPGDYYDDALTRSSNVFGLCYRASYYDYVDSKGVKQFYRTQYTSEVWGIFGLLKIMHDNWSYLFVMFLGVLVTFFSILLSLNQSIIIKTYYAYLLYVCPLISLFSMGIDHNAIEIIVITLRWLVFALLYYLLIVTAKKLLLNITLKTILKFRV